mmetsp:Transcript_35083/g.71817  ORF Transcript_35083/g.71817 Transcript_35083/m.71817 type:complete len:237 (-) Transcript_35083:104-814(-)
MSLLSHLRCGSEAGSNGPDGLIGNSNLGPVILRQNLGSRCELRRTDVHGDTSLALLLLLANSEHDLEASIKRDLDLLCDKLTVLPSHTEALAALGVADDDPRAARVDELRRADLPGVGAWLLVEATVLGGDLDVVTELGEAESNVEEGRSDGDLAVGGDGAGLVEGLDDGLRGLDGAVALPVAADEVLALSLLGGLAGGGSLRPLSDLKACHGGFDGHGCLVGYPMEWVAREAKKE